MKLLDLLAPVHEEERNEWLEAQAYLERRMRSRNKDLDRNHGDSQARRPSDEPTLFWYTASGTDLVPVGGVEPLSRGWLPRVDLFLYTDYWPQLPQRLQAIYDNLDTADDTGFPHANVTIHQMTPLQIVDPDLRKRLRRRGRWQHAAEPPVRRAPHPATADMPDSSADDAPWWLIWMETNHDVGALILHAPVDHFTLLEEVVIPLEIPVEYLCGKCDGCRKGGAWTCCNGNPFRGRILDSPSRPRYWVTDHWPEAHIQPGFVPLQRTSWAFYGFRTKLYRVAPLPWPAGETRTTRRIAKTASGQKSPPRPTRTP